MLFTRAQGAILQYKRFVLPTFQRPTGWPQGLAIFRYRGDLPGPKIYIQAAVHASEVQGVAVLHYLMEKLAELPASALCGEITLLPMASPLGMDTKIGEHTPGPFFLGNGQNWNRAYARLACRNASQRDNAVQVDVAQFLQDHADQPWETVRAAYQKALRKALAQLRRNLKMMHQMTTVRYQSLAIQKQAMRADRVLDLHTSTRGIRFAYLPNQVETLLEANYLHFPYFLVMGTHFYGALDEAVNYPWLLLAEAYRQKHGASGDKPSALTLELGSQEEILPGVAATEAGNILNWLRCVGSLSGEATSADQTTLVSADHHFINVCAPYGGQVAFEVEPGQTVCKGQRLAQILTWSGNPRDARASTFKSVISPMDGIVLARYPSSVVHQGTELYKLMTQAVPLAGYLQSESFY